MALSFRGRILAILVLLGALPITALIVGWAITLRTLSPSGSTGLAIEEIETAARLLVGSIDTTQVDSASRAALAAGVEELNQALGEAQRSMVYLGYYAAGLAVAILLLGAVLVPDFGNPVSATRDDATIASEFQGGGSAAVAAPVFDASAVIHFPEGDVVVFTCGGENIGIGTP